MELLVSFLPHALLTFAALVAARTALVLLHAHGWYLEKKIAWSVLRTKLRIYRSFIRWRTKRIRTPSVQQSLGLEWVCENRDWVVYWNAPPQAAKLGYQPTRTGLWKGPPHTFGEIDMEFVCDRALRLKQDARAWLWQPKLVA
jgi:hypothetical protein